MYIESVVDAEILARIEKAECTYSCDFEIEWVETTPEGLKKHGVDGSFLGLDSVIPGVSLYYVRLWVNAPFSHQLLNILEKNIS
jgi:hypothetical protein